MKHIIVIKENACIYEEPSIFSYIITSKPIGTIFKVIDLEETSGFYKVNTIGDDGCSTTVGYISKDSVDALEDCQNPLNLFEREKLMMIAAIRFAGKKGFDEFESAMRNKINSGRSDFCLSKKESAKVLSSLGMPDCFIEMVINGIPKDLIV